MTAEKIREAFEKWYNSSNQPLSRENEIYTNPWTQARWEAWQAAQQVQVSEAIKALKPLADYADLVEKICAERGYYSGDRLSLTEIPEGCPTLGMLRKCKAALAAINGGGK